MLWKGEPMSRLIDADELIAQMEADAEQMEEPIAKMFTYAAIRDVKHAPTIEERKTGKWKTAYLDHEAMGIRPKVLYCSECNQCIAYPTNFCPNCGAKMEGGDRS